MQEANAYICSIFNKSKAVYKHSIRNIERSVYIAKIIEYEVWLSDEAVLQYNIEDKNV